MKKVHHWKLESSGSEYRIMRNAAGNYFLQRRPLYKVDGRKFEWKSALYHDLGVEAAWWGWMADDIACEIMKLKEAT